MFYDSNKWPSSQDLIHHINSNRLMLTIQEGGHYEEYVIGCTIFVQSHVKCITANRLNSKSNFYQEW